MLGGLDPIIIFYVSKLATAQEASILKVPVLSSVYTKIGLPPIPIYLSEKATGLYIDTEEKSIEIETDVNTLANGDEPIVTQKAINSTIKIQMRAKNNSIGLTLLSALCDLILPLVSSAEYSVSYLHNATTVFAGRIHSFNVQATSENDLLSVSLELVKTSKLTPPEKPVTSVTSESTGNADLSAGNPAPSAPLNPKLVKPTAPLNSKPAPVQVPLG